MHFPYPSWQNRRPRLGNFPILLLGLATLALPCVSTSPALAQSTIAEPGAHPDYGIEFQPYLGLVGGFAGVIVPGNFRSTFVIGARVNWVLLDNGLIPVLNDSIALTSGAELRFGGEFCHEDFDREDFDREDFHCHDRITLTVPAAVQWNFWFTRSLSAFVEPGLFFSTRAHRDSIISPAFWVGGRYIIGERLAMTARLGTPNSSFGISWLF